MSPTFAGAGVVPEVELERKFTKGESQYSVRKGGLLYVCSMCRHYIADEKKCELVSEDGPPQEGEISPKGICRLWNAGTIRIALYRERFQR